MSTNTPPININPEPFESDPFGADEQAWAREFDAAYIALLDEPGSTVESLSPMLRDRLIREGSAAVAARGSVADSAGVPARDGRPAQQAIAGRIGTPAWVAWSGWAVAAALALAFVLFGNPGNPSSPDSLVASVDSARDMVSWPFKGTTDEFKSASGTVVWSDALQRGYMKLTKLPPTRRGDTQYQLWIVDPSRSKEPVDGGVFDVSADGTLIIPIDAKLAVSSPKAFAITREKPGGVVVSAGPLLFVAAP